MYDGFFRKTIENMRKHRDIKLVTTERRMSYLVSEPNFHTVKFFTEKLLAIEMRKTGILMNKLVYLGFPKLELNKVLISEFWYDYVRLKYVEKAKLCYMDRDSFVAYMKIFEILKDIAEDVETRFDTLNFELECNSTDRPLSKEKNKNVIGLMKLAEKLCQNMLDQEQKLIVT